jgi:(1->4)-alpha-D-glucan 1-alpha-D-glucosylmutase
MEYPVATYRVQFNPQFTFAMAEACVPYLNELGISHVYASPIFLTKSGSMHGYDVADQRQLNFQIGSREQFELLTDKVRRHSMGWLQDIVPNHMTFDSSNPLMVDLLENGPTSFPLHYFDIEWNHPYEALRGRLLAPFLGDLFGECLNRGEIQLSYDVNGFSCRYYGLRFPLKIETYPMILGHRLSQLKTEVVDGNKTFLKYLGVLYALKNLPAAYEITERKNQVSFAKQMLWELYGADMVISAFIDRNIAEYNGIPGQPQTFGLLESLLNEQVFKLASWKVANEELNYRRFFTINDLISLRVEDQGVFDDIHQLVFELVELGRITGLRIDHIDGLYDPCIYFERLRSRLPETYVIAEKILAFNEQLPHWPIQGTTGYEFLNYAAGLLCNPSGSEFDVIFSEFTKQTYEYAALVVEKKRLMISNHMGGDIDNLALLIKKVSSKDRLGTDMTLYALRRALVELMAYFPVYRTYVNSETLCEQDRSFITATIERAQQANPRFAREISFIGRFLLLDFEPYATEEVRREWIDVVMRFQQFTGPLMAKGFEDTTLYVYNRMIGLNDVGGFPERFGVSPDEFHAFCGNQVQRWPHSLNTTSTHDTKRGEDTRARILVLTEMPAEWSRQIDEWARINRRWKSGVRGLEAPDRNDEYLLYQTLTGVWPFTGDAEELGERLVKYMTKAAREAKVHSAWIRPDTDYEAAVTRFTDAILNRGRNAEFFDLFIPFQERIAWYGVLNSLTQCILKVTAPGIPDFYQGSELWDLTMVDPDNRSPVDYEIRKEMLAKLSAVAANDCRIHLETLLRSPADGAIKMLLILRLLKARRLHRTIYENGDYLPLAVQGDKGNHVVSFARRHGTQWALTVTGRFFSSLCTPGEIPSGRTAWDDTVVLLPDGCPEQFTDAISGITVHAYRGTVSVAEAFECFPGAVLFG